MEPQISASKQKLIVLFCGGLVEHCLSRHINLANPQLKGDHRDGGNETPVKNRKHIEKAPSQNPGLSTYADNRKIHVLCDQHVNGTKLDCST